MQVSDTLLARGAALFGMVPGSLRSLGGSDGAVYSTEGEGKGLILKFVPTGADQTELIRDRWAFAHYLSANGVRVVRPLPSCEGSLLETLEEEGRLWAVTCALRMPGRHADWKGTPEMNEALVESWGQVMGRMHRLTQDYPGGAHLPGGMDECRGFTEWCARACQDEVLVGRWQEMGAHLATLPQGRDGYGVVHNDLHPWNFLVTEEEGCPAVTVLDFDVCLHHWFVCDIATAVFPAAVGWIPSFWPEAERKTFLERFWKRFMVGYERENRFDACWLQEMPTFLQYRRMLLYVVFTSEWQAPNEGQVHLLREWRQGIAADAPVVEGVW